MSFVVQYTGASQREAASRLAAAMNLPFEGNRDAHTAEFALVVTAERLELRDLRHSRIGPVAVDFRTGRTALTRREPLARALGSKNRRIIDVTAGYGVDAALLAGIGYEVTMIERCPAMIALLQDGLTRLRAAVADAAVAALGQRLILYPGDARAVLSILPPPDAIYIDPMFAPKRKKTAAANKEMRILRDIAGDDADASDLARLARARARDRIVIKRADDAAALLPQPDLVYRGKLVRYDVYWADAKREAGAR